MKNASPGTGALATIYSDDGITAIAGSAVTTDTTGTFSFWAPDGRYDLVVTVAGFSKTVADIEIFDATETSTGDASVVFQTAQFKTTPWYDVKAYGALGNGSTDDTVAIQAALDAAHTNASTSGIVFFPQGTYKTTKPLVTYFNIRMMGTGRQSSIISKTTNTVGTSGAAVATPDHANTDNFNVDSIISVLHAPSAWATDWSITDLGVIGASGTPNTYGIFNPRSYQFTIERVNISTVVNGYYSFDNFLGALRNVTVITATNGFVCADDGSGQGTGTSMLFENCWANGCKTNGYSLFGLTYSSMNSVACDNYNQANVDTVAASQLNACYSFSTCIGISMNGVGAEAVIGQVLALTNSRVTIGAMNTFSVSGNTSTGGAPSYIYLSQSTLSVRESNFSPFVVAGNYLNNTIQLGSVLVVDNTPLPTGGNGFISYSGSSVQINSGISGLFITTALGSTILTGNTTSLAGTITKYNNIATVSAGIPSEIATVDLINQAAATGTTTLYAIPAAGAGQYRISWNAKVTVAATTSSTLGPLTITYTDPDGVAITTIAGGMINGGSIQVTGPTNNNTVTILIGVPIMINCKAGTNITFSFAYASVGATPMQYNLHLKLESL